MAPRARARTVVRRFVGTDAAESSAANAAAAVTLALGVRAPRARLGALTVLPIESSDECSGMTRLGGRVLRPVLAGRTALAALALAEGAARRLEACGLAWRVSLR